MKNLLCLVVTAASLGLTGAPVHAQCTANTYAQLQALLDCIANCGTPCNVGGCSDICTHRHIVIPFGILIAFDTPLTLTHAHQGLRLTIDGTLQWTGDPGSTSGPMPVLIRIAGQPQTDLNITIDGGGTFRTIHTPCQDWSYPQQMCLNPPGAPFFIAEGILIEDHARQVTVRDITLQNMYMGVRTDGTASHILLHNLKVQFMTLYGIFNDASHVTIQNCTFNGAYHGFGIGNHGSNVQYINCSVSNAGGGFHVRGGNNIKINGFNSFGQACTIGPDPGVPDPSLRVTCLDVRNVVITGEHPSHLLRIEMGTGDCWIENLVTQNVWSLEVGRNQQPGITDRPLNGVYWKALSGWDYVYNHPCIGPHIGPRACQADLTGDGAVNVNDLLEVINGWGSCGVITVCGQSVHACLANVPGSEPCGAVNVNDLLAVINAWGPCTAR